MSGGLRLVASLFLLAAPACVDLQCAGGHRPEQRTPGHVGKAPSGDAAVARVAEAALPSAPWNPPSPRAPDFDPANLRFIVEGQMLFVTEGDRRVSLERANAVGRVRRDANRIVVHFTDEIACDPERHETYTVAHLRALLALESAHAHQRRHEEPAFVEDLLTALRLDASLDWAHVELTRALLHLGDRPGAVGALATLGRRNVARAYFEVLTDPELSPLAGEEAITRLWAGSPGTARLSRREGKLAGFAAAYSARHHMVAVRTTATEWGTGDVGISYDLLDVSTGEQLIGFQLGEGPQGAIESFNRLLRELGFEPAPANATVAFEQFERGWRARFPSERMSVVADTSALVIHVIQRDTVLGTTDFVIRAYMNGSATLVPEAHAFVLSWEDDTAEGCDSGASSFSRILKIGPRRSADAGTGLTR